MMYDTDLNVPTSQILADLAEAAMQGMNGSSRIVGLPLGRLAIKLTGEAEKTAAAVNAKTHQLIVLTRWLIGLTVAILVLTAPLVFIEIFNFIQEHRP